MPFTGPIFHHLGMIKSILLFEVLTLLYLIPELVYNLDLQYLTCVPPPLSPCTGGGASHRQ